MHSCIIQLSDEPIASDEHITPDNINESDMNYFGMDYVVRDDGWDPFEVLEACLPKGMFVLDREKRTITPTGDDSALEDWFDEQKKMVAETSFHDFVHGDVSVDLKYAFQEYHHCAVVFYIEKWCGGCDSFLSGIMSIFYYIKKTMYIGGVLDYHF